jgi:hypothetical protein
LAGDLLIASPSGGIPNRFFSYYLLIILGYFSLP